MLSQTLGKAEKTAGSQRGGTAQAAQAAHAAKGKTTATAFKASQLTTLRERLKAKDYLSAAALAETFTAANPNHSLGWLMLTEAQRGLGDKAAALATARRLTEIAPHEAWPHQLHALLAKR